MRISYPSGTLARRSVHFTGRSDGTQCSSKLSTEWIGAIAEEALTMGAWTAMIKQLLVEIGR